MLEKSSSGYRTIELTVLSGEDLRVDRRLIKKNAFAIVQTDTSFEYSTTKVDESGGSHPSWNEKLVIDLPMHARFITVQVQCKSKSSSSGNNNNHNKIVGFARIPVSDFIGGYAPENYLHFLSYRLRNAKGDKNGIINVSVRSLKVAADQHASSSNYLSKAPRLNVQGYVPACSGFASGFGAPVGGVVTGVPVWCANRA